MIRRTFKEIVQADAKNVFMNPGEFGEPHIVNGKTMNIILDNNELMERQKLQIKNTEGLYLKKVLIYVYSDDFGLLPPVGKLLKLDGKNYVITDAVDESGIYSISLEANRS